MYSDKDKALLAQALKNATRLGGITQHELSLIFSVSPSTISKNLNSEIDPNSLKGNVACYVIKIFRSLIGLSGNNKEFMNEWLHTTVTPLGGKPIELMQNMEGLLAVNNYLDYINGEYGYS